MIDLYTWTTPNGRKASIMLEACELEYRTHPINIGQGEQFSPDYSRINPNHKIPAIIDSDGPEGKPIRVFESGAILIYLAEKTGRYLPTEPHRRMEVLQWLMWQMGGFGPFLGQAHHFNRFAKEPHPYAIERYTKEAQRLWGVLNQQLIGREYVADQLSIADFAIYPWADRYEFQNINPQDYPEVARWMQQMKELECVRRGMAIPSPQGA